MSVKKRFCSLVTGITFSIVGIACANNSVYAEETDIYEKTGIFIKSDSTYDLKTETTDSETETILTDAVSEQSATQTITQTIPEMETNVLTLSEEVIDVFSVYNAHKEFVASENKEIYNGIDVSRWQGDINWQEVKDSGVDYAIIRAGYGRELDQVDVKFHQNMQGADEVGMDCGIYWYSYATTPEAAVLEAEACYNTIKDYQLEYPVVFDIEDECQKYLSAATISAIIESFCTTMEEKGYYVTIYSYASFLRTMVYEETLEKYDVWVAHYGVEQPSYSGSYGMWQYTSEGSVPGIEGNVDLDYAYKNYPAIMKEYHLNGY